MERARGGDIAAERPEYAAPINAEKAAGHEKAQKAHKNNGRVQGGAAGLVSRKRPVSEVVAGVDARIRISSRIVAGARAGEVTSRGGFLRRNRLLTSAATILEHTLRADE